MLTGKGVVAGIVCVVAGALAAPAFGSQLIERNTSKPVLKVNSKGVALLLYKAGGQSRHVFVSGAVNGRYSDDAKAGNKPPQVKFKVDYSGGRGAYKHFVNACKKYDGPKLDHLLAACKAPDGSYWALQNWQTELPIYGFAPWLAKQKSFHLQASHWTGDIAKIDAYVDWTGLPKTNNLFGKITYQGHPVYGFGTTSQGEAQDGYIRQIYVDTYNSPAYAKGWQRENAFVSHKNTGTFCYAMNKRRYMHKVRGPGNGKAYRIFILGPGVSPDVSWQHAGLGTFDPNNAQQAAYQAEMETRAKILLAGDPLCS